MDPGTTLAEIFDLIAAEPKSEEEQLQVRSDLIERLNALAGWLQGGGFMPQLRNPRVLAAVGNLMFCAATQVPEITPGMPAVLVDLIDMVKDGQP